MNYLIAGRKFNIKAEKKLKELLRLLRDNKG